MRMAMRMTMTTRMQSITRKKKDESHVTPWLHVTNTPTRSQGILVSLLMALSECQTARVMKFPGSLRTGLGSGKGQPGMGGVEGDSEVSSFVPRKSSKSEGSRPMSPKRYARSRHAGETGDKRKERRVVRTGEVSANGRM